MIRTPQMLKGEGKMEPFLLQVDMMLSSFKNRLFTVNHTAN